MENVARFGFILSAVDNATRVVNTFVSGATKRLTDLQKTVGDVSRSMRDIGKSTMGAGVALEASLALPMHAAMDLDSAMADLQVAVMNKNGGLPSLFKRLSEETIELGNVLPGTTEDFVRTAQALSEQGVNLKAMVGGGLEAAAHLSVVLKMPSEAAGEMVAKLREAFQLSDEQLAKMADLSQKARFAFGLKSEDLLLGAKYYGGSLNRLNVGGVENVKRVYAIQGVANTKGIDGSTFGTNFSMMLTRIGTMKDKLSKSSKEMKHVNAELAAAHINMQFFDKRGNFMGVDNLVHQLGKLSKLNQEKQFSVTSRLFGEEASRVAGMIIKMGDKGYSEALEKIKAQASLETRLKRIVKSDKNTWEAFTGTLTNMLAAIGQPLWDQVKPVLNKLNNFVGGPVMKWIAANTKLIGQITLIVAVSGAFLIVVGGLLVAVGTLGGAIVQGLAFAKLFVSGFGAAAKIVLGFGRFLVLAARWAVFFGQAVFMVGRMAFALNPLGLAITAVALLAVGAGLLIFKYWRPISAFFRGLVRGLMEGFAPLWPALVQGFNAIASVAVPVLKALAAPILAVGRWLLDLLVPVNTVGGGAEKMGKRVGLAIAAVVLYIPKKLGELIANIVLMLPKFLEAGKNIGEQIGKGITSSIDAVKGAIGNVTKAAREYLPFSPAKAGAFRDLHRVRIVETVAEAVRPAPLARAMSAATTAAVIAVHATAAAAKPFTLPAAVAAAPAPAAPPAPRLPAPAPAAPRLAPPAPAPVLPRLLAVAPPAPAPPAPRPVPLPALVLPAPPRLPAVPAAPPAPAPLAAAPRPLPLAVAEAPRPVAFAAPAPIAPPRGAGAVAGGKTEIKIDFRPQVTVQGGSDEAMKKAEALPKAWEPEIVRMVKDAMQRENRAKFDREG